MELLTPRELSQKTDVQVPTASGRVTIRDPSDTLGDPVIDKTTQQLVEAAGRHVANRSVPVSGVTAPYGTIDDAGTVEFSSEVMKKTGATTVKKFSKKLRYPMLAYPGDGYASVLQPINLESSDEHAATTSWNVAFDVER